MYIGANSELSKSAVLLKKMLKKINGSGANQSIETPVICSTEKMKAVYQYLKESNYTVENCAARLGVDITGGINFIPFFRKEWKTDIHYRFDVLISLFIDSQELTEEVVIQNMGVERYHEFLQMKLLKKRETVVFSEICLFPCYEELYIATDRAEKNEAINQVMYLWGESFFLADVIDKKERYSKALDLCTGSGVHALVQSRHCESVIGVDINERAVAFANFNKALNNIENVEFHLGSMFETIQNQKFDLIIANPPYNPDLDTDAGSNFWSGGIQGDEILKLVFQDMTEHIEKNGLSFVISLFPNKPEDTNEKSIGKWMNGKLVNYDVMDYTYPAKQFVCPHVKNIPSMNSEAYRFGLIVLRKKDVPGGSYRYQDKQFFTFALNGALQGQRISRSSF